MNISIESHLLNHPRRSGLLTYTEGLVNSVSRVDQENIYKLIYYSFRRKSDEMPGPEGKNIKKVVLKVPDQDFFGRRYVLDNIFLPGFFRKHQIDIFHRTSGYTVPDYGNVFKILTVHDLRTLTIQDQVWEQNIEDYKKVFSKIDICVVVSECTKRDLVEHFGLNEKKIKVVYLGADERYRPTPSERTKALQSKLGIDGPYLLSVGSVPRKNIDGILRAFAGCSSRKDYRLVLTCRNDIKKYKVLINELNISNRVVFASNIHDDDIVALYTGCHCFVFPSLYEGFGLPIVEAMQCGAPVITSNISSCPEVAGDAALCVDPNNISEISDAIDQMCRSEDLRQSFIKKGYERAKRFSWEKFGKEMKAIYSLAYRT